MAVRSQIVIVTDNADRLRADVFGGTVPAFARIVSSALDLDTIRSGDDAFAIFHAPRDRPMAIESAWRDFWIARHPRCGLTLDRMAGFARWRAANGLKPHPAISDMTGEFSEISPLPAAVAGRAADNASEVTR